MAQAVLQGARREQRAVLQVVRRRRAERVVQLPRPSRRSRQRRARRRDLRSRRRHRHARHLCGSPRARVAFRQCAEKARDRQGRPRRHLYPDVDRRHRRDAGLCAHRRDALGRVRRLLREVVERAARRRRRDGARHGRRAGARRQDTAAQEHRGRSDRAGRLRGREERDRLSPHRRQDRLARRPRPVDARTDGRRIRPVRAGMGRRRASAVHPVYVGLDRQAEGRAAQHGRLPAVGRADDEVDLRLETHRRVLVHGRHRLGHGPHVHHVRPARVRRHAGRVRRRADLPGRRPLLEDDRRPQGHRVLHRADRDPLADQGGRGRRQGPSEKP
ncbi:hypothetical protein LMG29660_07243 [Burkholderia puraquae]|uniref:Uncharacterized protein n=1 Tax=Burkholderia puraquae TaxID=1904757 RepID=A0A6J5F5W9_9BURK|nr:hypothetical protein LMG29660_07243 [Burkholderia puraquae]